MTHRRLPWVALAVLALALPAGAVLGSEKLAKQTGKECTTCHDKPGSKLLTDAGKYFEMMRTLDGYDDIHSSFGHCTSCHVRRPGSKQLTRKGKQFQSSVKDMAELREWVRQNHPAAPAPAH